MPGMGTPRFGFRLSKERPDERRDSAAHLLSGRLHEHAKIRDDHFVAAASCVQLLAQRPEHLRQRRLDEVMHVLCLRSVEPLQAP